MKDKSYRVNLQNEGDGRVAEAIMNIPEVHDLAYQLRSALDGAVWQAVTILEKREPTDNVHRLEFPIYGNVAKFNQNDIHKHKLPKALKDWLESILRFTSRETGRTS